MLNRNPNKRLGSSVLDAEEIKNHKFFSVINWKEVYERYQLKRKLELDKPPIRLFQLKEKIFPNLMETEINQNEKLNHFDGWSFVL